MNSEILSWNYERGLVVTGHETDIICPQCKAGYRRIEVASGNGTTGEFRCRICEHILEVFDGSAEVAIRLTVQPQKTFQ
jgi:transposase-like protein